MIRQEIPILGEFTDPRPHIQGDMEKFSQSDVDKFYIQCADKFIEITGWCLVNRHCVTWQPAAIWGMWTMMEQCIDMGVSKDVRDAVAALLPEKCVLPEQTEPFEFEVGFATDIPRDGDDEVGDE